MPSPEATFWLAAYGAIVSSAALLWNVARDVFDRRRRLKVSVAVVNMIGQAPRDTRDYINVSVTNLTPTDAHIQQVGALSGRFEQPWRRFIDRGDRMTLWIEGLPRWVKPSEKVDLRVPVLPQSIPQILKMQRLFVQDSAGKRHHAPRRDVRSVKQQVRMRRGIR